MQCSGNEIFESEEENEVETDDEEEAEEMKAKNLYPLEIFKLLSKCNLQAIFPNVFTIYKGMSTLPVSSASAERTFSIVRLIKDRLRSTMGERRLEDLMLISCEGKFQLDDVTLEKLVDALADTSKVFSSKLSYV